MVFFSKKEFLVLSTILISFILLFFLIDYNYQYFNNPFFLNNQKINDDFCFNNIEVYFCPEDFCSSRLINEINLAEKSIFVAIYSFTHHDIANALIEAKKRGLDVKVVFDFLQSHSEHSVQEILLDNMIGVSVRKNNGIMHNKFLIIDEKKVFTGSFNYSLNADTKNDENLVFIVDEKIAKLFLLKFEKLFYNVE